MKKARREKIHIDFEMSQLLLENIEQHISLSDEEKEVLLSFFKVKKLRKRQYFLQEGDVSKHSAFILSGCLRSYFVDENGLEHILQFAVEDWWITDMMSIITQNPSKLNIDAVEDSEMLIITRENQEELLKKIPQFERYFRIKTESGLAHLQSRLLENLSLPAKERYTNLLKKYPKIVEKVPQKQIASYLGITPEFLSKIRNQMVK